MRKLASIRQIADIREIPGAEAIEAAQVDGWQVVVKKGEFRHGDQCIYFEIDSFLPVVPAFEFLAKSGTRTNGDGSVGYRLRTIKLRGTLSQGLALPMSTFFEHGETIELGADVSDLIGVSKWEPPMPACLAGNARGNFPGWIRKTDQERIQNVKHMLNDYGPWEVTLKLDGSSMTAYHRDGAFGVCSRNLDLQETEGNTFWTVARRYGLPENLAEFGNIAVQGELIGEGIQGNPENIHGHDFYVFDVWLIDDQRYATPQHRRELCAEMGLKHVPVLHDVSAPPTSVDDALRIAEGPSLNPNTSREGLVYKRLCGTASWKVISNQYLLKQG